MSSSASSWMTSTTSSTVMTPMRRRLADHRRRYEVVLVEDVAHLLLIGLGGDRLEVRRHDVAQLDRAPGAEQPVQRDPPDRPMARVDDVDLVEVVRMSPPVSRMWSMVCPTVQNAGSDTTSRCMRRRRCPRDSQAFRDTGSLLARDRVEDLLALRVVEILQDGDGIVALHVLDGLGGPLRADLPDQLLADLVLDMGKHVAAQHIVGDGDEAASLAGTEPLDQIGNVGLVQGRDQARTRSPSEFANATRTALTSSVVRP